MGDATKTMSLDCDDDAPCTLDAGQKSGSIKVIVSLTRAGMKPDQATLSRIDAYLVDTKTQEKLTPTSKLFTSTGVVVSFPQVAQRRFLLNATEKDAGDKVIYEVVDEPIQVDASRIDSSGAQTVNVEMHARVEVTLRITVEVLSMRHQPPDITQVISSRSHDAEAQVRLEPSEGTHSLKADVTAGVYEFQVLGHRVYKVTATPRTQTILPGSRSIRVGDRPVELTVELKRRCRVYYITIDSVRDHDHSHNLHGMRLALASAAQPLHVEPLWYADLSTIKEDVFALFFGGNYDEWAGDAAQGRGRKMDEETHPETLRKQAREFVWSTELPIMSVCGSHQLMAYLWHEIGREKGHAGARASGWEAIGHVGNPFTIADELAWREADPDWAEHERAERDALHLHEAARDQEIPLRFLSILDVTGPDGPYKAVNRQVGDFWHKIVASSDPIFQGGRPLGVHENSKDPAGSVRLYDTHRDEVRVVPPQFDLIVSDPMIGNKNWVTGERLDERKAPSLNQGMRLRAGFPGKRLLYSFQFHPEFFGPGQRPIEPAAFRESNDGEKLLHNFMRLATEFWEERPW